MHIYTAQRGGAQGPQDIFRRHKVGRDGQNLFLGEDDAVEEAFGGDVFDGGRAAVNEPCRDRSNGFGVREKFFGQQRISKSISTFN
jgi:hypothetical protein